MSYTVRWMIRRDMVDVLAIEAASFEFAWNEEDFIGCLRQWTVIGMVAETDDRIVGFMVYELLKSKLHVLNLAVPPWWRRRGVGAAMVNKLKAKLSQQRRRAIVLETRETNLDAQRFFRSQGFRATGLLRNHYDDTAEDAYVMEFAVDAEPEFEFAPRNRLTAYFGGAT